MVTNTYEPGRNGVAVFVRMLRRELRCRGHEVEVLTAKLPGRVPDPGVHEVPSVRGLADDFPWPLAVSGVPRSLRGERFDIVHVHHPVLLGPVGKRFADACGCRTVFTAHSVYTDYLDMYFRGVLRPLKPSVARHIARFVDGFDLALSPSTHVRRVMRDWGVTARIEMLEGGADVEPVQRDAARAMLGVPPAVPVALSVARLAPEKRHDVTIREFALALRLVPDARLVIVGDGGEWRRLERLAGELGVGENVRILGGVDREQLAAWYSAADVLVASSLFETGPLTVVEAMACGTPTVAYDAPGFEDRVTTGDNGILADRRHGELAAAMASVLGNGEVRARLSAGALHHAAEHTTARVAETLLGYYEELLSSEE